jgi:hypothetical protein
MSIENIAGKLFQRSAGSLSENKVHTATVVKSTPWNFIADIFATDRSLIYDEEA